jgi:hypothetical protein
MDIAKLLAAPANHDPHNVTLADLQEENDRLRRLLAATARSYNAIRKELDICREELGHNKSPISFLKFPREVRDQIYSYALSTTHVNTEPRPTAWLAFDYRQMKPATPNICLANKQVYRESLEVLYSKNAFRFERPGHLLQFEKQIGSLNCDLVRHVEIATSRHLPGSSFMVDPDLVAPCDYQAIPTHWAKALSKSKLKFVTEMVVINYPSLNKDAPMEVIPVCLKTAIEGVFARNRDSLLVPRVTLEGFGDEEWKKLPQHWKVKTVKAVLGLDAVVYSSIFASSALASDHGNFGFLPGQDEEGFSDSSGEWDIPPWKGGIN